MPEAGDGAAGQPVESGGREEEEGDLRLREGGDGGRGAHGGNLPAIGLVRPRGGISGPQDGSALDTVLEGLVEDE